MDRMFAPWRQAFIEGRDLPTLPLPSGCIFCDLHLPLGVDPPDALDVKGVRHEVAERTRREWDRSRLVVTTRPYAFVILNRYPYGAGHVMVVPRTHTSRIEDLPVDVGAALHGLLAETVAALRAEYEPQGMNLGMNMGRAGGAGVEEHIHFHVLPRWAGDVNFMPALLDTKVVSAGLDDTWERLARRMRRSEDDNA